MTLLKSRIIQYGSIGTWQNAVLAGPPQGPGPTRAYCEAVSSQLTGILPNRPLKADLEPFRPANPIPGIGGIGCIKSVKLTALNHALNGGIGTCSINLWKSFLHAPAGHAATLRGSTGEPERKPLSYQYDIIEITNYSVLQYDPCYNTEKRQYNIIDTGWIPIKISGLRP